MKNYEIFSGKDLIVAAIEGEIVSRAYPDIEKEIVMNLNNIGNKKVVFNMEKVGFIDSSGIIFLLRLKSMISSGGGFMVIYNLQQNIEKSLVKLRLNKVLNLSKDAEQCFIDLWYMASDETLAVAASME